MTRIETILGLPLRSERWNTVVTINTEQAKRILEDQPSQRPINQHQINNYMAAMRAGQWLLTHQGLAADENGQLLDGQHRLWACFMSGLPLTTRLFLNEPRDSFDILDTGLARTVAQMAIVKGQTTSKGEANSCIAALRFIWAYDLGRNPTYSDKQAGFSSRVADAVLERHPNVFDIYAIYRRENLRRFSLPAGHTTALLTMFFEADAERAARFVTDLGTGVNLQRGDPVLVLRESGMAQVNRNSRTQRDMTYRLARAWNARMAGRTIMRLYGATSPHGPQLRAGTVDIFPDIKGYIRKPITT